ncbi:hypothetical protein DNTS_017689 [Danionella cerebrum]|uniref:alpha-N-acetylgalactosaminide alpha-2,6-sialyltransferase n=1 Tax=Danionella cerebrum TaxID=2873325 RepID=A0A553RKU7_9TELE|nr:hypothetical protein DNTS_017689 [Danionella translucida]
MQKGWSVVSLILSCCMLLYLVLWSNLSERFLRRKSVTNLDFQPTTSPYKTEKPLYTEQEAVITPIPILYKDNFTQLPVWDFEDFYLRDHQTRNPICPKSLHNNNDPEFKEAVLPDIRLWFYNGNLNISEWNRLAHFNNPFGFMEYKYNEIKEVVELIPKPKSPILLPVPKDSPDGCIRCAVVGTGGILNNSRLGKEIDSHDYVFRMNGAITQGFEEDVGNRTSVYGIKYVMIPEGMRDFEWLQGLLQGKESIGAFKGVRPLSYFNGHFNESRFYVLHPDFLRYVRNRFMPSKQLQSKYWAIYRPTNGAFALFLALHVDAYGFITEDHLKYSNYYYEKLEKTKVIFYINHDYNLEIKTWKKLHQAGIIKLFQGH